jgi:hypothetical protein
MPRFQRSETTNALIRYLAPWPKGTSISYDELSQAVSVSINSRNACLLVARRVLQNEHLQMWACVPPNVGLVLLTDAQRVEHHRHWNLGGARNKLTAGGRVAETIDLDLLTIGEQARFATDSVIRSVASEALSRTMQRRVEKIARGSSNDLPAFNAIEWAIALTPRRSNG